jgi:hypothetical protein
MQRRQCVVLTSVADPWHFDVDPDPDLDTPDPCLWLMDPDADPDPAVFVLNLQDDNKKQIF